jgi:PIN domain nuclease of toxin-antitoxin system
MRVLLDTVAFLFAIEDPDRLSPKARIVMGDPANQRDLSVISLAEIAMNNAAGKLNLSREDAMDALGRLQVSILPCAEAHVFELMTLPVYHRDPFDRMLIAQALAEDVPVMTCDKEFGKYKWFCQLDLAPFDLLIWLHLPGESTPARPVFCCNKLLPDEGRVKVLS